MTSPKPVIKPGFGEVISELPLSHFSGEHGIRLTNQEITEIVEQHYRERGNKVFLYDCTWMAHDDIIFVARASE